MKKIPVLVALIISSLVLSGCAYMSAFGESFNRSWNGVSASLRTYNEQGQVIDEVHGTSLHVERNRDFDTTDSAGTSNNDSRVLSISIGSHNMSHVGSSMVIAQDGLVDIMDDTNARVDFQSTEPGTPWLNHLVEKHKNLWQGSSKTIMIRSQDGSPIAVYTGSEVEIYPTDIPSSTWFRIDGKYLFVYRADITTYDTALLTGE